MKKMLLHSALAATLLLSACGPKFEISNQSYTIYPPEAPSTRNTIRMNSVLDENLWFKIKYDPEVWELKDTPGDYMTNLILNHKGYKDETCVLLPGTKGYKIDEKYEITQWDFRSEITFGTDYEFANPVTKIPEIRVFEANSNGQGFPTTLFELHYPTDGQDGVQCRKDYEQVIGTYAFESYTGTPEELQSKLSELEALDAAAEAKQEEQFLQEQLDAMKAAEEAEAPAEAPTETSEPTQ